MKAKPAPLLPYGKIERPIKAWICEVSTAPFIVTSMPTAA